MDRLVFSILIPTFLLLKLDVLQAFTLNHFQRVAVSHVTTIEREYISSRLRFKSDTASEQDISNLKQGKPLQRKIPQKVVPREEIDQQKKDDKPQPETQNNVVRKIANGVVPIAASLGFAATPSSKLPLKVLGAAAGGIAGYVAKETILPKEKVEVVIDENTPNGFFEDFGPEGEYPPGILKGLEMLSKGPSLPSLDKAAILKTMKYAEIRPIHDELFLTLALADGLYAAISRPLETETDEEEVSPDLLPLQDIISFIIDNDLDETYYAHAVIMTLEKIAANYLVEDEYGFYPEETTPLAARYMSAKLFFIVDKLYQHFGSKDYVKRKKEKEAMMGKELLTKAAEAAAKKTAGTTGAAATEKEKKKSMLQMIPFLNQLEEEQADQDDTDADAEQVLAEKPAWEPRAIYRDHIFAGYFGEHLEVNFKSLFAIIEYQLTLQSIIEDTLTFFIEDMIAHPSRYLGESKNRVEDAKRMIEFLFTSPELEILDRRHVPRVTRQVVTQLMNTTLVQKQQRHMQQLKQPHKQQQHKQHQKQLQQQQQQQQPRQTEKFRYLDSFPAENFYSSLYTVLPTILQVKESMLRMIVEEYTLPIAEEIISHYFSALQVSSSSVETANALGEECAYYLTKVDMLSLDREVVIRKKVQQLLGEEFEKFMLTLYERSQGNNEAIYRSLITSYDTYRGMRTMAAKLLNLQQSGSGGGGNKDDKITLDRLIPMPVLPFAKSNVKTLYAYHQEQVKAGRFQSVKKQHAKQASNNHLDLAPAGAESFIHNLLSDKLSTEDRLVMDRAQSLPSLLSWIKSCIAQRNYAPSAKTVYQTKLAEYKIPENEWLTYAMEYYSEEAKKIANKKMVPEISDMEELTKLAAFLDLAEYAEAAAENKAEESSLPMLPTADSSYSRQGLSKKKKQQRNQEILRAINLEIFGEKFMQAVTEAMTPTGVINEEYRDGLNRLAQRMNIAEDDCTKLLAIATTRRLKPMIQEVIDIWKVNTDSNYRYEQEILERKEEQEAEEKGLPSPYRKLAVAGEDGSNSDSSSSSSLVAGGGAGSSLGFLDLSKTNNNAKTKAAGLAAANAAATQEQQKKLSNTEKTQATFMREVMNMVTILTENLAVRGITITADLNTPSPINALAHISNRTEIVGVFEYYLLNRLVENNEEKKERFLTAEPLFAKLLGLSAMAVEKCKMNLAYRAFKGLLVNALEKKEYIEIIDTKQFTILEEALPLPLYPPGKQQLHNKLHSNKQSMRGSSSSSSSSSSLAKAAEDKDDKEDEEDDSLTVPEKIYSQACRDALLDHARKIFNLENRFNEDTISGVTPISVRRFRHQVHSLDYTFADLQFSPALLTYFFISEVQYIIEQGLDEEELPEVIDAYAITEKAAKDIISLTAKRYLSQVVVLAMRGAKRFNEEEVIPYTQEIMKYAKYYDKEVLTDSYLFTEEDKDRLINFYINYLKKEQAKQRQAQQSSNDEDDDSVIDVGSEEAEGIMTNEDIAAVSELLKKMIVISENYVKPNFGVSGLLGITKDLESFQRQYLKENRENIKKRLAKSRSAR